MGGDCESLWEGLVNPNRRRCPSKQDLSADFSSNCDNWLSVDQLQV